MIEVGMFTQAAAATQDNTVPMVWTFRHPGPAAEFLTAMLEAESALSTGVVVQVVMGPLLDEPGVARVEAFQSVADAADAVAEARAAAEASLREVGDRVEAATRAADEEPVVSLAGTVGLPDDWEWPDPEPMVPEGPPTLAEMAARETMVAAAVAEATAMPDPVLAAHEAIMGARPLPAPMSGRSAIPAITIEPGTGATAGMHIVVCRSCVPTFTSAGVSTPDGAQEVAQAHVRAVHGG
jgi:hypothetical protein